MKLLPHKNYVISFEALFWLQNLCIEIHGTLFCNNYLYNLNIMLLYALCCVVFAMFSLHRELLNMILGDEPLLSHGSYVTNCFVISFSDPCYMIAVQLQFHFLMYCSKFK
jgi:hypothetical protein